jgi:hypothetical protein
VKFFQSLFQTSASQAATIVGVAATVISVVISISQCHRDEIGANAKIELERQKQKHEIRGKYLDLALAEKSDAYEKGRVLRFLKLIDDDSTIKNWATSELGLIEQYKLVDKKSDDKFASLTRVEDSIRSVAKSNSKFAFQLKDLQDKRRDLKKDLDSLRYVLDRTAKEASIVSKPHGFKFEDIKFVDIPIGPNCNLKSILSSSGKNEDNMVCYDSYANQSVDSVKYENKKWFWVPSGRIKWDKAWDKEWKHEVKARVCQCEEE